ncbi:MAG: cyclic 2,3-diphosphoglycerate synthase [Thermoplasmata archaeon]|jgi:predicted GTPase
MNAQRVVIMGAAGRDFHNFNVLYRGHPEIHVVAFTAAQIPNISGRVYPPSLAGPGYPHGIPIVPEKELTDLVRKENVDFVMLAYSDLSEADVMHKASAVLAAGPSFVLAGPRATELPSSKPVVSICAVRTGSGKSPLSRYISKFFRKNGLRVAVVRHPMPYGDLAAQAVQRFATIEDLDRARCTIEEREEYEPHLREGVLVFAGVDYEAILRQAEKEADVILWDGGNNDLPFFAPNLQLVVADPWRAGHELSYYPGEVNFRMADVIVISKTDSAPRAAVETVEANAAKVNPRALVARAALNVSAPDSGRIRGRRVLVVEDGPTVTHGGLDSGAGTLLAEREGAIILDARPFAVGSIARVYEEYPHLHRILPAMGYSDAQVSDLEATIRKSPAEFVIDGSPINLGRLIKLDIPIVDVSYDYEDLGNRVRSRLEEFLRTLPGHPKGAQDAGKAAQRP